MNEDIVAEEGYGLGKDGVVMVEDRSNDPLVEDGAGQDVDQKNFSLSYREVKEVDGDFVGGGVQDQGHDKIEGVCLVEHLISSTSRSSPHCYQTASACPSNQGQGFVVPMR